MLSHAQMYALCVVWVGGWGFVFFSFPEVGCRIFRLKDRTPKRLRLVKIIGAIELAIVFVACAGYAILGFR
jgi:hypothetical protein